MREDYEQIECVACQRRSGYHFSRSTATRRDAYAKNGIISSPVVTCMNQLRIVLTISR